MQLHSFSCLYHKRNNICLIFTEIFMQIHTSSTIPIFQIGKRSGDDTLKVTQGGNYVACEISRWANCGRAV